jgi:RNA polymerase sigma-70 factor (ECF subfamily)
MDVPSRRRPLPGISDEDLWSRLAGGDESAFAELHGRYAEPIRSALRYWLEDDVAAEDLTAETLARAWEKRTQWRPHGVKRFLMVAARNLARDYRRSETARVNREQAWLVETSCPCPSTERLLHIGTLGAALRGAILALPRSRRRAFVLTCIHRYSHREVAERMGLQPKTVEHHVALAKAELRAALGDYRR